MSVVPGLFYVPNFISRDEHRDLLVAIGEQAWCADLKRRTQHYGYKYDYRYREINPAMKVAPIPEWLGEVCSRMVFPKWFLGFPDQAIVNEYQPGQGIANHVDCVPCFEDVIASLSLGGPVTMDFTETKTGRVVSKRLQPRSLIVLTKQARYDWQHGIVARMDDNGIPRRRRVSVTFRRVILNDELPF